MYSYWADIDFDHVTVASTAAAAAADDDYDGNLIILHLDRQIRPVDCIKILFRVN